MARGGPSETRLGDAEDRFVIGCQTKPELNGAFLEALFTRVLRDVHRVHLGNVDRLRFPNSSWMEGLRSYVRRWASDLHAKVFPQNRSGSPLWAATNLAEVVTEAKNLARLYDCLADPVSRDV